MEVAPPPGTAVDEPPSFELPLVGRLSADRWLVLFLLTRTIAVVTAVALLIVHRVTSDDSVLLLVTLVYGSFSVAFAARAGDLLRRPPAWIIDSLAVLALIYASGDWRSPFYLMLLSTLALPTTQLWFRPALLYGAASTLGYLAVAVITGLNVNELRTTARLETLADHLLLPLITTIALAYAASTLRRLAVERRRSERLAVEAERKRIAWELHDSAKQRVHAAHLVLSSLRGQMPPGREPALEQAIGELGAATADMQTSLAELQSPLEGRPLHEALRERAGELSAVTGAPIVVNGREPELSAFRAAHAYRIVAEAMVNAVRHASAEQIAVDLHRENGSFVAEVVDDGAGMPDELRPDSNGLRSMRSRTFAIGGVLSFNAGPAGQGTVVRLELPLNHTEGAPT